ncbi:unnamed protein product [Tilletia controversa]|nr:hypothetical protein CF335_g3507 [Tilletia laevis]CAD6907896.1 unnamed protein product [Tilletia caries]CAD6925860.1 unnamed protein product [Tilletia controversa]
MPFEDVALHALLLSSHSAGASASNREDGTPSIPTSTPVAATAAGIAAASPLIHKQRVAQLYAQSLAKRSEWASSLNVRSFSGTSSSRNRAGGPASSSKISGPKAPRSWESPSSGALGAGRNGTGSSSRGTMLETIAAAAAEVELEAEAVAASSSSSSTPSRAAQFYDSQFLRPSPTSLSHADMRIGSAARLAAASELQPEWRRLSSQHATDSSLSNSGAPSSPTRGKGKAKEDVIGLDEHDEGPRSGERALVQLLAVFAAALGDMMYDVTLDHPQPPTASFLVRLAKATPKLTVLDLSATCWVDDHVLEQVPWISVPADSALPERIDEEASQSLSRAIPRRRPSHTDSTWTDVSTASPSSNHASGAHDQSSISGSRFGDFVASSNSVTAQPEAPCEPLPASAYFDLVIIGSGPAALALIARLMEKRPAALYLDEEHRYLHWLHSKDGSAGRSDGRKKNRRGATVESSPGAAPLLRTRYLPNSSERAFVRSLESEEEQLSDNNNKSTSTTGSSRPLRILILDRIGGWLGLWNRLFAAYEIPHLRSPMFFHPSPADLDALVAYAERTGRSTQGSWQPDPLSSPAATTGSDGKESRPKKLDKSMRRKHKDNILIAAQAASEGRPGPKGPELIEIRGCVGKEITKHRRKKARAQHHHNHGGNQLGAAVNERDRRDYFTPGTRLFHDFIREDVIRRYGLPGDDPNQLWPDLSGVLQQLNGDDDDDEQDDRAYGPNNIHVARGEVKAMSWHHDLHIAGQAHVPAMLIRTADGSVLAAGTVVSAIGPGGVPNVPAVLRQADAKRAQAEADAAAAAAIDPDASAEVTSPATASTTRPIRSPFGEGWAHSSALALPSFEFPPPSISAKIRNAALDPDVPGPTCVVIGGGLTSAQLCVLALRKGFGKVILLLRGHLKVKPFDVTLDWLSKWANTMKMQYWMEDDPARRLEMLRSARNGGSITPSYARYLRELERAGLLEIRTHVEIDDLEWEADEKKWKAKLRCTCADSTSSPAPPPAATASSQDDAEDGIVDQSTDSGLLGHHEQCEPCPEPACTGEGSQGSDSDCDDPHKGTTSSNLDVDLDASEDMDVPDDIKTNNVLQADYILSSTGPILSLTDLPAFSNLARTHPIASFGGLPLVSEDLQWMSSIGTGTGTQQQAMPKAAAGAEEGSREQQQQPRLFVVGAYSALQLGPAAFNLGGMREAAERVGSRLLRDWEAEAEANDFEAEAEAYAGADVEVQEEEKMKKEIVSRTSSTSTTQRQRTERRREPWQTGRWSALAQDDALLVTA